LAEQGRCLVAAGLADEQARRIHEIAAVDFLDSSNFCPDFELAVARAITMLDLPAIPPHPGTTVPPIG
jgi:hypothetical protein